MEDFKLLVVEKNDFEKLDVIIGNIFSKFGGSGIGSEERAHSGLIHNFAAEAFPKAKVSCKQLSNGTSVLHRFDIKLRFWKTFKLHRF